MRGRKGGGEGKEGMGAGWAGMCKLWGGLGLLSRGRWEPWRAVGEEEAGPDLSAHRRLLAAVGGTLWEVGAGMGYKSVPPGSLGRIGWLGTGKGGQLYPSSSLVTFEF